MEVSCLQGTLTLLWEARCRTNFYPLRGLPLLLVERLQHPNRATGNHDRLDACSHPMLTCFSYHVCRNRESSGSKQPFAACCACSGALRDIAAS